MVGMTNNYLFNVLETCKKGTFACSGYLGSAGGSKEPIITGVPGEIVNIISIAYFVLKIIVPIVLIIMGMVQIGKAVSSQKEDELRNVFPSFLKKLIIAVIVFIILSILELVVGIAGSGNEASFWTCVKQILNGKCS